MSTLLPPDFKRPQLHFGVMYNFETYAKLKMIGCTFFRSVSIAQADSTDPLFPFQFVRAGHKSVVDAAAVGRDGSVASC